jgi:hypothetical protein
MLISDYPPFQAHNHRELFCKIRAGDFIFRDAAFGNVSIAAKTLIANLLTVSVDSPWMADQALQSDWFQMTDKDLQANDLSSRALPGFQSFSAQRRWKAAKTAIIWASNQPFWNPDGIAFSQQMSTWDKQAIKEQMANEQAMDANNNTASKAPTRVLTPGGSVCIPVAPLENIPVQCVSFSVVYHMIKKLRLGSSAMVWPCSHIHTNEIYAVKVIDRRLSSPRDDENVLTEVATMQSLSGNRYCVQLLDFYEEPDCFYLVMEYMDGGDVFERIVNLTHYTEKDARDLAVILLKAVQSIRNAGIAPFPPFEPNEFDCVP